jgi:hypothetical protein
MLEHTRSSLLGLTLAAAFLAMPSFVAAQAVQQAPTCTAEVMPAAVEAGERAVPIAVTVSEPIGEVTGVSAPEGSGITLAAPADLPRQQLAADAPAPQPIAMADADNTWIVYLNLAEAEAGAHELTFTSGSGGCRAELTVE